MNTLALRKQAILLEAALHRARLGTAHSQLAAKLGAARRRAHAARWWLWGATIGAGLVARRLRGSVPWLPVALTTWRMARSLGDFIAARDGATPADSSDDRGRPREAMRGG